MSAHAAHTPPTDLNSLPLGALFDELSRDGAVRRLLELARDEDLGPREGGDVTSRSIIPDSARSEMILHTREGGVCAGLRAVPLLLDVFAADASFTPALADGDEFPKDAALGALEGRTRDLLAVERTLLNLIGRCCGVATRTRAFVRAVEGTGAAICETRKTLPGHRALDKYSCRCGGATLHRLALHDAALYKDNHLAHVPLDELPARLADAAAKARAAAPLRFVEVEVDSLEQLERVLTLPRGVIDIILLDNMTLGSLRRAVALRGVSEARPLLEASGGVRLETVRDIAATGVDRISVGSLTHGAPSLDVGLDAV